MDSHCHLANAMTVVPMYSFGARSFIYIISFQHRDKVGTFTCIAVNGQTKAQGKCIAQGHTIKRTEPRSELRPV